MATLIELHDLARSYGGRPAVRGVTLSIAGGEIFGLLGPNGAGKSTTLKMLATLLLPSAGEGRVAGYDLVTAADSVRRHIGYVPEGAELYDVLTGEEFLDLVRDLHRLPAATARARRAPLLRAFDLGADVGRTIGEYSKGMKQKLLLIAALQHDPEVLLLDEPMDGLDVNAQEALKQLLRERAAAGGAVVYSSHILEVVERLCTRVAILAHGSVAALGSPRELLEQSADGSLSELFLRITSGGGGRAGEA
ncbi:MAG TPA: ABC transporter ATP-binding protein [Thermoanaerobaculia bacterium]|jgi:ABC-2 type transport system ATP-binding protein|nr:ABC transporter ATP-binding protein [Thermoanaerobaculia bacterium]